MENLLVYDPRLLPELDRLRDERLNAAKTANNKLKIYLDTKYWIYFKDIERGINTSKDIALLFDKITQMVNDGIVICPFHETILQEIFRQSDEESLSATLTVIEKLSHGFFLLPWTEILTIEILYTIFSNPNENMPLHTPQNLAWGCELDIFKKEYRNLLKILTLPEYIKNESLKISNKINQSMERGIKKFSSSYNYELEQAIIGEKEKIIRCFTYYCAIKSEKEFHPISLDGNEGFILNIFWEICKKSGHNIMQTTKIGCGLYSHFRVDSNCNFEPNHNQDIWHAAIALPYCDYFFTEANLTHIIKQKMLGYDKLYSCKVFAKPSEILKELNSLKF